MSGFILCQVKRANQPFFLKNIQVNIFSIEELCYFLYHNLSLADESVFNEELCFWISNELGLVGLGQRLRILLGRSASLEDLVHPIFKEVGYLTYDELKSIRTRLNIMNRESLLEREKHKGDAFVINGMYAKAIALYHQVLEDPALHAEPTLRADILHNLGCAYSYMFQMEKAAQCFREALDLTGSEEDTITYLLACSSIMSAEEYDRHLLELGVSLDVSFLAAQERRRVESMPAPDAGSADSDHMLAELMAQYHKCTAE